MKEFIFEVERRVYGWMKDRLSIEAETPEEERIKRKPHVIRISLVGERKRS